ncbi:hypothetical protein [Streptomyces geysiriensis]|uniref:hypothetical protein n=1 Tax=Streptomyces geysiriensis TaxID=68207 RepID=UPI0035AC1410
MDLGGVAEWARALADDVEGGASVDAAARARGCGAEGRPAGAVFEAYGRLVACGQFM